MNHLEEKKQQKKQGGVIVVFIIIDRPMEGGEGVSRQGIGQLWGSAPLRVRWGARVGGGSQ